MWYPGRSAWETPNGATTAQGNEAVLNMQKSAQAIAAKKRRAESAGVLIPTGKRGTNTVDAENKESFSQGDSAEREGSVRAHIVISHDEEYIYLITSILSRPGKWGKDFKSRRKQ